MCVKNDYKYDKMVN